MWLSSKLVFSFEFGHWSFREDFYFSIDYWIQICINWKGRWILWYSALKLWLSTVTRKPSEDRSERLFTIRLLQSFFSRQCKNGIRKDAIDGVNDINFISVYPQFYALIEDSLLQIAVKNNLRGPFYPETSLTIQSENCPVIEKYSSKFKRTLCDITKHVYLDFFGIGHF